MTQRYLLVVCCPWCPFKVGRVLDPRVWSNGCYVEKKRQLSPQVSITQALLLPSLPRHSQFLELSATSRLGISAWNLDSYQFFNGWFLSTSTLTMHHNELFGWLGGNLCAHDRVVSIPLVSIPLPFRQVTNGMLTHHFSSKKWFCFTHLANWNMSYETY